jgi:leucyl aminopeptidase (aminopeptidase T)
VHGAQLPRPVVEACAAADVFFLPTSYSQTHTDARIRAIKNGARGATMCDITEDALCTGAILGDFEECDRIGRIIGAMMDKSSDMRMTTPAGTDIKGVIRGRPVQYETGLFRKPGQFGAFPDSEVNISPVEGTAEGKIVADVRVMSIGVTRRTPVTLHVRDGSVYKIEGGPEAEDLVAIFAALNDPTAYNLAEFAVGLNPCARPYSTNLEDLGKLGFGHCGIGSNYSIGGSVRAPCHIDAMFKDVTMYLDGKPVLDRGNLLI